MKKTNQLDKIKSLKLLQLWGQLPNPDHRFLSQQGRSPQGILRDLTYSPEIQSAILARESAVIGDPWQIICDSDSHSADSNSTDSNSADSNSADFITENLNTIGMNKIFREIFQAIWYGYTVLQHPMEKINGTWFYTKIDSLPSDWFSFTAQGELVPSNHSDMSPLNTRIGDIKKEVELVQYRPSFINPYGESLLARVFWSATWIRGNMDLWISYIDRFGDDSIIGKLEIADDQKKIDFMAALTEFKSSGAMIVEGSDEVEILKTDKSSSSALFKGFHEICVQQVSKLVLGHASALEAQAGKLGNDQSLSIVRQDITQDDKSVVEEVMNRLIQHFCLINNIKDKVFFSFIPEKEDERQRIERDQKLVSMGFELSEEYICKAYKFGDGDIRKQRVSKVNDTVFLSSEQQRNWIPQKQQVNNAPNFSEDSENGKKGHASSTDYYKNIDLLIESGISFLKKDFSKLLNKILKELAGTDFWEDGLEAVLQIGNNFELNSEDLALKLLNAQIIGRSQVANKIESLGLASFGIQDEVIFSTFREAEEYLQARFNISHDMFVQSSNEIKQYAFSVSSLAREDSLAQLSQKLLESYDEGLSFASFKKSLQNGKLNNEIADLTDRQLNLIYTQNMNSAYSYGRYQGLMQAVEIFPDWEYVTIGDKRVRPSHAALNGTIRKYDDPFWRTHYPPNGYACRCVVEVSTEDPNGEGIPKWDKEHADIAFEKGGYPKAFELGKKINPDEGFDHNIGEMNGWIKDRISKMNTVSNATRTSFFTNTNPLRNWDKNKNVISTGTDYSKLGNGLEKAKDSLLADSKNTLVFEEGKQCFFDKKGNMVGSDLDYVLDHISTSEKGKSKNRIFDETKWKSRAKLVDVIKDIIETGDIVEDIERYGKNKKLVLSRKYIKNVKIDGENTPVMIVAEYPKFEKDSIPTLTTVYPFKKEDQNKKISGIFLK